VDTEDKSDPFGQKKARYLASPPEKIALLQDCKASNSRRSYIELVG